MKNVRVSDHNHAKLRLILLELIAERRNPALTFDDVVGELLDLWEAQQK